MLTLALDTSMRCGSVALGDVGPNPRSVPIGERTLEVSATHSETVLPAMDHLLNEAGMAPSDIEAVVVGSGPGSFTGVRIAAALARGFCFHTSVHMYSYSSLAAIALDAVASGACERSAADSAICALVDARRGQVYAAGYRFAADLATPPRTEFAPRALALEDLLAELAPGSWCFAGPLSADLAARLETAGASAVRPTARPTAAALLGLLALDPGAGRIADPSRWEPEYIRASSAERRVGASS